MENEKRKVGDYTVLCAMNIGSREIILAENEQDSNGERFLCCYGERNDIFEKFTECAVGDDYIDAALFFAERIKQDAERFRAEVEKLDIPVTVITQADCIPDHYKNDINGKIIAINPAILKPEYQRADRQLYINHTLIYRKYTDEASHFAITTPKTKSGVRIIPMLSDVKAALTEEYKAQLESGFNTSKVDGYSGFIFKSRYNTVLSPHCVNRAIDRELSRRVMPKRKKMQKRKVESLSCYRISVAIICDTHSALGSVRTKPT